jgi:hypothetical protein
MKNINVTAAFVLTHSDGSKTAFAPGFQQVKDEIASHWYVQAHSVEVNLETKTEKPPK